MASFSLVAPSFAAAFSRCLCSGPSWPSSFSVTVQRKAGAGGNCQRFWLGRVWACRCILVGVPSASVAVGGRRWVNRIAREACRSSQQTRCHQSPDCSALSAPLLLSASPQPSNESREDPRRARAWARLVPTHTRQGGSSCRRGPPHLGMLVDLDAVTALHNPSDRLPHLWRPPSSLAALAHPRGPEPVHCLAARRHSTVLALLRVRCGAVLLHLLKRTVA